MAVTEVEQLKPEQAVRYTCQHPELSAMWWETYHAADKRRPSRKLIQLAVDLTTFCGSAAAALIAFWSSPVPQPVALTAASVIEACTVALPVWQFTASPTSSRQSAAPGKKADPDAQAHVLLAHHAAGPRQVQDRHQVERELCRAGYAPERTDANPVQRRLPCPCPRCSPSGTSLSGADTTIRPSTG